MTPRKPKQRHQQHRHNPSNLIQASDYESDAQTYNIPPTTRTNTELNLSVLRRYNPTIRTILSIAANAVIYLFTPATQQWEKSNIEGTLFVCDQDSTTRSGEIDYCVVVLNRRGLENLILDLSQAQDVEVNQQLLIMRFQETDEKVEGQKTLGVWIHNDKDDTWEVNSQVIQQCWEKARSSKAQYPAPGESLSSNGNGTFPVGSNGKRTEGSLAGRRISLTDLFGQATQ